MQYLWIVPALILYTFICGLIIHLIEDRHNRKTRREAARLRKAWDRIYRAVPPNGEAKEIIDYVRNSK